MSFLVSLTLFGGAAAVLSASTLAFVVRGVPTPAQWGWWAAGVVTPAVLTFGVALLAERTSWAPDALLVICGFSAAFVVLVVGHVRTRERAAWWLGNAVVAAVWFAFVVALVLFFRSVGPDF